MKAYKVKIELVGSDPLIWRQLIIPAGATFYRLYDTIQFSMGWLGCSLDEYHLYEFEIEDANLQITNNGERIEENKLIKSRYKGKVLNKTIDPYGVIEQHLKWTIKGPCAIKIDPYMDPGKELRYTYDFGDDWQHRILVEAVIDDYPFGYPALLDGAGDCPPEDVGGWSGYLRFLEAYANPKHKGHKAALAFATDQRYRPFDLEWTNDLLKHIKIKKTEWEKLGLGNGHFILTGHELDKYKLV